MSEIQSWVMMAASYLLRQSATVEVVTLAATAGALLLLAVVALQSRRHRLRVHDKRAADAAGKPGTEQRMQAVRPLESALLSHLVTHDMGQLTVRRTTTGPLRERSEWRSAAAVVPSVASRPAVDGPIQSANSGPDASKKARPAAMLVVENHPGTATLTTERAVDAPTPEALAEQEYRQGLRLVNRQGAERESALLAALRSFRRAQEYWTRERAPERWAALQNDIGRVYQELPSGDRAAHIETAILHHESALEVFDPLEQPMNWAWTQAALGAAYLSNPRGSAITNARAAVAYYQRALDIFTRENAPLAWAWNQNNLGAAFETVRGGAEGERVACLRSAAECYERALTVFTGEAHSAHHGLVSCNLERVRAELRSLE